MNNKNKKNLTKSDETPAQNGTPAQSAVPKPIKSTLRAMEVGDVEVFPIKVIGSVRAVMSLLSLTDEVKFNSVVNREERTFTVTRTA